MQFIVDGIDFPLPLVDDLLEDRAVLFCGAGVSMNEGLPGFRDLAGRGIAKLLGTDPVADEDYRGKRYEAVFQALQDAIPPDLLFRFLEEQLSFREGSTMEAHQCLVRLAENRRGSGVRIVTTNFDLGFQLACRKLGVSFDLDTAPRLPPVRRDWWSIVALHGTLEKRRIGDLVLTSGQYGLAYMTEGWAARFVAELFRRHPVVFVGYSADDPVIRYVVDAYRSRETGDADGPPTYALVGSTESNRKDEQARWERKHVVPLWYKVEAGSYRLLYDSLSRLAEIKREGAAAPRVVAAKYCNGPADLLSAEEESQVLWALGKVRDRFLQNSPGKPLFQGPLTMLAHLRAPAPETWLKELRKLGLEPKSKLVGRWPRTTSEIVASGEWTEHVAAGDWILHQLESVGLIRWVIDEGGYLSPVVAQRIMQQLYGRPREPFNRAWFFLCDIALTEKPWYPDSMQASLGIYGTTVVEQKARALLDITLPAITCRSPYRDADKTEIELVGDLLRAEIDLPIEQHPASAIAHLFKSKEWPQVLAAAASGLIARLDELGALITKVESLLDSPPIDIEYDHSELEKFPPEWHTGDWRIIPSLALKALESLLATSPRQTLEKIKVWMRVGPSILHERVNLTLLGKHWMPVVPILLHALRSRPRILNDYFSRRRLIAIFAAHRNEMSLRQRTHIGQVIVKWFSGLRAKEDGLRRVWKQETIELLISLYGTTETIEERHPELRDEIADWKKTRRAPAPEVASGWVDSRRGEKVDNLTDDELAATLGDYDTAFHFVSMTRDQGPARAISILQRPEMDAKAVSVCLEAITRWLEKEADPAFAKSAEAVLEAMERLPEDRLGAIGLSATGALRAVGSLRIDALNERLLRQVERCVGAGLASAGGLTDPRDPITDAINSGAYHLVEAAGTILPKVAEPGRTAILPEVARLFKQLLSSDEPTSARSALALASRLPYFQTLDPDWTKQTLIPLFASENDETTRYAWAGLLWNPRFTPSLAAEVAPFFAGAIDLLREDEFIRPNLGALPVALHVFFRDQFDVAWLADNLRPMNGALLAEALRAIARFLPEQGDIAQAWSAWVRSALAEGLPVRLDCYSPETSLAIVDLIIALGPFCEQAFEILEPHMVSTEHTSYAVHRLDEGEPSFVVSHPQLALRIVRSIASITAPWERSELERFLARVKEIEAGLVASSDYKALRSMIDENL